MSTQMHKLHGNELKTGKNILEFHTDTVFLVVESQNSYDKGFQKETIVLLGKQLKFCDNRL